MSTSTNEDLKAAGVRPCFGCMVFDDHPRHVIAQAPGQPEEPMHMDCCAEQRGCSVCTVVLQAAGHRLGVVGDDLRAKLVALPPVQVDHIDGEAHGAVKLRSVDSHLGTTAEIEG